MPISPRGSDSSVRHVRDERIVAVMGFLGRERARPPVDVLLQLANLSRSRLDHLFKHEVGVSMAAFGRSLRLHRAAALLEHRVPVKVAQYQSGFSHPANFCHVFRQHFFCSPSDFRRVHADCTHRDRQQKTPTQCACSDRVLRLVLPPSAESSTSLPVTSRVDR